MGIQGFMNWEFVSFTPMFLFGDRLPWSQSAIDREYEGLLELAHASVTAYSPLPKTSLLKLVRKRIPGSRGFLGFGATPDTYTETVEPERPGGWRVEQRLAYRNYSDCGWEWPRHRVNEQRCDEVWLRPDGSLHTAMIGHHVHFQCPDGKGPVQPPFNVIEEAFHPAKKDELLAFDIRYTGGILGRDPGYGRHEEFRPHTGNMKCSERPFQHIAQCLKDRSNPDFSSYAHLW
jgi:hypothetical protein